MVTAHTAFARNASCVKSDAQRANCSSRHVNSRYTLLTCVFNDINGYQQFLSYRLSIVLSTSFHVKDVVMKT